MPALSARRTVLTPASIALAVGAALTVSLAAASAGEVADRRSAATADHVVIVQGAARGTTLLSATSVVTSTKVDGSATSAPTGLLVG